VRHTRYDSLTARILEDREGCPAFEWSARFLTRRGVTGGHPLFDHGLILLAMASRKFEQLTLDHTRYCSGRGGPRVGAGRPRGPRPRVLHRRRERLAARIPLHVTIRLRADLPSLRQPRFVRRFRVSLSEACVRHGFRVVHYSIQRDHVHLLIEAQDNVAIACGMKCVGARIGKLVNRLFGRSGPVLDGRYHRRPLGTPLEVRRALCYVLLNHRHHATQRRSKRLNASGLPDPASSGRWFDGWSVPTAPPDWREVREVAPARTWLLRTGWRRHRLIDPAEVPG
jgi:REP element-mobilizing transposase RayT